MIIMLNSNPKYNQQKEKEKEKIESNVYNSDTIYNIYDIILFQGFLQCIMWPCDYVTIITLYDSDIWQHANP